VVLHDFLLPHVLEEVLYCCFTAALLLLYCCVTAALLLRYCCFCVWCCMTCCSRTCSNQLRTAAACADAEQRIGRGRLPDYKSGYAEGWAPVGPPHMRRYLRYRCCFTAALLLLYCCFTAA
jgi:hypothetical protein